MPISLYLDENMTVRLVRALADLDVDAVSANALNKGADDPSQLLVAGRLGRALVTNNTSDYLLLHHAWLRWTAEWRPNPMPRHAGIILMHTAPGFDYVRTAQVLAVLAEGLRDPTALANRAFAWNPAVGWHER